MVRIAVDFNRREGVGTIALGSSAEIPEEAQNVGALIILYEPVRSNVRRSCATDSAGSGLPTS